MSDARTTTLYDSCCTRSNRTSYTYSSLSQLTSRTYPDGSRGTLSDDVVGNRTLMADSTGRSTYTYDPANQLNYGQVTAGRTTYTYDLTGNQPTVYQLQAGTRVTMYDNGDNRRTKIQEP